MFVWIESVILGESRKISARVPRRWHDSRNILVSLASKREKCRSIITESLENVERFFLASNKSLSHYEILCNVLQGFEGVLLALNVSVVGFHDFITPSERCSRVLITLVLAT